MSFAREPIYQAIFNLLTPLRAPGSVDGFPDGNKPNAAQPGTPTTQQPFNCVTREIIEVQRVLPALQPVLIQYEFDEAFSEERYGMVSCELRIGFMIGIATERTTIPQSALNTLADSVLAAIAPPAGSEKQTLGGLVDRVVVKGNANKNGGNNSTANWRQGAFYLPVSIFLAAQPSF